MPLQEKQYMLPNPAKSKYSFIFLDATSLNIVSSFMFLWWFYSQYLS